MSKFVQVRSLK